MARQFVPYTIDSFTGGITDKVVKPSNPVQYETLKNLIPQRDESLRQRDGFKLWDNTVEDLNILQMFEFQGFIFYYCSDKKFYYRANSGVGVPVVVRTELNSSTYTATSYDGTWHINDIQGELILTHEPTDKTSLVNPADPSGNNPTEYPPLYRRTPLRRIYIDYTGTPRICTAQLPRFTHDGTRFTVNDDEIYVVPDEAGNDSISYYEFYWKYSYNILMNNEIVRKEIYGEPTYTTMKALGSNSFNKVYWKEFDYRNRFGSSAANTITNIARTDQGLVTVNTGTVHGYTAGQSVIVLATTNTGVNGKFIIRTVPSTSSFTYQQENIYTAIVSVADTGTTTGVQIVDDRFTDNEMWNVKTHANTEIDAGDCIELVVSLKYVGTDTEYYVRHHNLDDPPAYLYPDDSGSSIHDYGSKLEPSYVEQGYAANQSLILGSYFNTVVEGKPFFGNMSLAPNRVYQGLEDASAWTNIAWFADFSGVLTGLDNFSGKPIAFTSDATYRIEGQKFQDSSGSLYTRIISDSHGCIASRSLVRTQYGLFFWSKSGIFICDGLKANRISDSLQARYKSWITTATQKNAVKGWYDDEDDKVYWVVQESNGHTFLLVLDLHFGISNESVFYIIDSDHSYWNITDGMLNSYDNKILIAGNEFVQQPDPSYTYDVLSSYVSNAVVGLNVPIKYDYKSPVITYNDKLGRKWTSHIVLNMKDSDSAAGVSTRIRSYADLSANPHYLDPCFYYQKMYSDNQEWGNIDPVWGESQRPIFKRYFDQSTVRNTFIQIGFDNLKIVRYTDADYGKANYLQTSSLRYLLLPNTLFINSPITANEALDGSWYIKLEEDDYETEYPITSIQNNSTFLQINLPLNTELTSGTLAQSNHGWKLCQISKVHRFHLLSYSLLYTPMGHRTIPGYQPEKMNGE